MTQCLATLKSHDSDALEPIRQFADSTSGLSLEELQELYTRTFDINPLCALEVGWHLFGERYERGTFIVKMRQTLREYSLPESAELPDHLTHVLEALGEMNSDDAREFAHLFVLPALEKMLAAYDGKENVYANVLDGIRREVINRHGLPAQGENDG